MRRSDGSGPILSMLSMGPDPSDRRMREDDGAGGLILPIYFIAIDNALAFCSISVIDSCGDG